MEIKRFVCHDLGLQTTCSAAIGLLSGVPHAAGHENLQALHRGTMMCHENATYTVQDKKTMSKTAESVRPPCMRMLTPLQ